MRLPLLLTCALLLAACTAPKPALRNYWVSGGKMIQLPVSPRGALPSQTNDVRIEVTGFMVDPEKAELTYGFGFTEKHKNTPRKVIVEDVTLPDAVPMVTDEAPSLDPSGYWKGATSPKKPGDPSLKWLLAEGNTEKVFKFSITLADGRTEEIYQASIWSGQMKPLVRKSLQITP